MNLFLPWLEKPLVGIQPKSRQVPARIGLGDACKDMSSSRARTRGLHAEGSYSVRSAQGKYWSWAKMI